MALKILFLYKLGKRDMPCCQLRSKRHAGSVRMSGVFILKTILHSDGNDSEGQLGHCCP